MIIVWNDPKLFHYVPGTELDIAIERLAKKLKTKGLCRCGSSTRLTRNLKQIGFKKANLKIK